MGGFEPPTSPLPRVCSTPEPHEHIKLERVAGIEPASSAWKAEVLPLYHTRITVIGGGGWIRTTEARASDLQSDPFGHSGTPPYQYFATKKWCRHQESNSGPTDYKSVALPTELYRHQSRSGAYINHALPRLQPLYIVFFQFLFPNSESHLHH